MFRKFFSFFFSKAEVPKETYGKEEKNGSLPLRFTVRMSKHRRLRSRKRMQKVGLLRTSAKYIQAFFEGLRELFHN